jgi:hypothetical protein
MRGLLPPPPCHIFSRDPADERATIAAATTRLAHLPAWQRTSPMSRTTLEEAPGRPLCGGANRSAIGRPCHGAGRSFRAGKARMWMTCGLVSKLSGLAEPQSNAAARRARLMCPVLAGVPRVGGASVFRLRGATVGKAERTAQLHGLCRAPAQDNKLPLPLAYQPHARRFALPTCSGA